MSLSDQAAAFLVRVIPYLDFNKRGLSYYESWVEDCSDDPAFPAVLAEVARLTLAADDEQLVCSALQALATVGSSDDLLLIREFASSSNQVIAGNAVACLERLLHRMKSLEDLLDEVVDCKSFIVFVTALARERQRASEIESQHRGEATYMLNGALGWNNSDIPSFLWACLSYFHDRKEDDPRGVPSWRNFAEMLYCGKIIE